MERREFHFTLGPVQGFVAQARRTRDFWAGSFLLSWLSAVAMRAVRAQNGSIIFPQPHEPFMMALEGATRSPPFQGTIPNRFKAAVPDDFDPSLVEAQVRAAWEALATHVWSNDLAQIAQPHTRAIWDRQIGGFWDIQWALSDDPGASNLLDRLKNWRTHAAPDEPGVKCMMMNGWQELSGCAAPGRRADDPQGPASFWQALRDAGQAGMTTDLREGEMLCAIAFVKRRFARWFDTFKAVMPSGWQLLGWKLPTSVPSVHYLAAAPWLAQLLDAASKTDEQSELVRARLIAFHDAAHGLIGGYGEWDSNVRCVRNADGQQKWKAMDGTVFFDAMLENTRLWGDQAQQAKEVLEKLKSVRQAAKLERVSPFYAVLLMDGDELGIHMSVTTKQQAITQGLARFTGAVKGIVEHWNGFLIYAGGDDVLALLPLEDALQCAADLRADYLKSFEGTGIPTSLSGAIQYAHVKMPLGKILHDAHDLLDRIAKDKCGRDGIACRVWKPGGMTLEWAMPWECALQDGHVILEQIANEFRDGVNGEDAEMASKFFYRIRERFELLNPSAKGDRELLDADAALDLMAMEYLNSGVVSDKRLGMGYARDKIKPLLEQCRPVVRDQRQSDPGQWTRSKRLEADGALLVRFLAHKGVDR